MPVAIIGSPFPLVESLELQAIGVMVSFEAKSPDIAPLEVGPKGASLLCSLRSARLAVKSHEGTFKPLVPHSHLPNKVISRRRLARPRLCSLRFSHRLYCWCSFSSRRCVSRIPPLCRVQGGGGSSWSPWMSRVVGLGFMVRSLLISCLVACFMFASLFFVFPLLVLGILYLVCL
jgi:hypothetical protein